METTYDWLNIIRFHRDIVRHSQDSFYQLDGDGLSSPRFSKVNDNYVLDSLEGPWVIPGEHINNQTFLRLLESSEAQENLILGLFSFVQWGKSNPILIKEVRVEIDEEGMWNLYPEQAMWDISPNFISYLRRNEMAASDDMDDVIKNILEKAYDYAKAFNTNVIDSLLEQLVSEFGFLKEVVNSDFVKLIIFKMPDGVSIYDKNLMDDYNAIENALLINPCNIGGLKLLDQMGKIEEDEKLNLNVLPVIPLNISQTDAVQGILKNKPITVISGPPGCGKSQVVISSLINCWAYGKSVLFASQNNKAVDVVRERFANINTMVPIAIRAGSRSHNTVQNSLATIRQACVGISNTAKGSIQKAKNDANKILVQRKELQDFLDSKLPARVDEAYRSALQAHASSLSFLAQIQLKNKELEKSLEDIGAVTCKPENVKENVLSPFNEWLSQIKLHLMEIEAEESNRSALQRKKESLITERNSSFDFCGIDSSTREDWSKVLNELNPQNFERWIDDFRSEIRNGYREALTLVHWKQEYDYWSSEEDCHKWHSAANDWIIKTQNTLADTANDIKKVKELESRYSLINSELINFKLDISIDMPLEIIQDWYSFYGELITLPENWINKLPFSKQAILKRKLSKLESVIRKYLPLESLTSIGEFNDIGRINLARTLESIRKWFLFKESHNSLIELKNTIEEKFSILRNSQFLKQISLKVPSNWEQEEWLDTIIRAKKMLEISLEAGKAWKKRVLYEEAKNRIHLFEEQLNKMIGKSFILSSWLNYQFPELLNSLYDLSKETVPENLINFEEVLYNKRIDHFNSSWNKAFTAQNEINDVNEQIRKILTYEDHVKKWWKERPHTLTLGSNIPPVVFPDNQNYLFKLRDNLSEWYKRWDLFNNVEKVDLYDSAKEEHEYALQKLLYTLEIAPSEIDKDSLKALINSDKVRQLGNPWPEKKLEEALSIFSPLYIKGKIAACNNKVQANSIKIAEAYWKERVATKPETLNKLNDLSTQFTRGNISVANFENLLDIAPIWVTTTQSTKGFPVAPEIFDVLIVDEASQCTLTNLIPLVYRAKTLVVIGDKEQLPAIPSIGEETEKSLGRKYGLEEDLISLGHYNNDVYETAVRVLPGGITNIYNLNEHYRSLPHIIVFSNRYIYGKQLVLRRELSREVWESQNSIAGVFKINVSGSVERGPRNSSWINRTEMDQCIKLIQKFKTSPEFAGYSFGIVTPFRAQKEMIEERLAKNNLLTNVTVGVAHTFQGDERDIMIFSPVVARNMPQSTIDWVEKPHNLINVAVTRARDALYVVGDYEVMRRQKGILGNLARYVEDMETVRKSSPAEVVLLTFMGMEGWTPLVHPYIGGVEVDFVLENEGIKLVIEVDGKDPHKDRKLEDASRDAMLRSKGYRVTRIPARDVLETPNVVIDQLKSQLA